MSASEWLIRIGCVGAGGAIGAALRYGLNMGAAALATTRIPLATLTANLVGCFLIGVIASPALRDASPRLRLFLAVGLLGGLTTFSSYALEIATDLKGQRLAPALTYALASNLLGVLFVLAGLWVMERRAGG